MKITATQDTFVKRRLAMIDSMGTEEYSDLGNQQSIDVQPGTLTEVRKHFRFLEVGQADTTENYRFIYQGHVKVIQQGTAVQQFSHPEQFANSILLDVPYLNQRNNLFNPDGSCNVTAIGMVLKYKGKGLRYPGHYEQLEDELYDEMSIQGWNRHEGYDLAKLARDYGLNAEFTPYGSIEACKEALRQGSPVVLHGYFTAFGHIIVAIGYDEDGLIVHDPFGEWHSWGYDRNTSDNYTKGKKLHYSYKLIRNACMPDNHLWMHTYDMPEAA